MTRPIHESLDAIDHSETTGFNGGRLAATVLLLRDGQEGLEVWLQERVSTMRNYPGHAVFPGGGVDPRDFPPRMWSSGAPPVKDEAGREPSGVVCLRGIAVGLLAFR